MYNCKLVTSRFEFLCISGIILSYNRGDYAYIYIHTRKLVTIFLVYILMYLLIFVNKNNSEFHNMCVWVHTCAQILK